MTSVSASQRLLRPAEVRHSELDRSRRSLGQCVDLGELVFGAGQADPESFDLAEPALVSGIGDAGDHCTPVPAGG
jgi:hypothetical protein